MGKKSTPRRSADNEARAVIRSLRVSPQKLNLVAQSIRGKNVQTALNDLEFSRRRIARQVKVGLESAIANAENNHQLDVDRLIVAEATPPRRTNSRTAACSAMEADRLVPAAVTTRTS